MRYLWLVLSKCTTTFHYASRSLTSLWPVANRQVGSQRRTYFFCHVERLDRPCLLVLVECYPMRTGRPCPSAGCDGQLELRSCHGLAGNPVTHFWRTEGRTVYFQAKGLHDHPRPDVCHRTSTSKAVLVSIPRHWIWNVECSQQINLHVIGYHV